MEAIQSQIQELNAQTEEIFLFLAEQFPALMNKKGGSSLDELQRVLQNLKSQNDVSNAREGDFFSNFDTKYNALFDSLNKKIEDLSMMNSQVKTIKEDSEEMELITLNAMVVSIKSGEKGRAFSKITDNLKRMSNQMFQFSDDLINEEQELLQNITAFKTIFNNIIASQKLLANLDNSGNTNLQSLITTTTEPLNVITDHVHKIYVPIQHAMEGLQMQDIIRQAINNVLVCLKQCSEGKDVQNTEDDSVLDNLCFNIELMKITQDMLRDVIEKLDGSIKIFKENWTTLTFLITTIENERRGYIQKHLSDTAAASMTHRINEIIHDFTGLMKEFNHYGAVQKDLEYTTKRITDHAHMMFAIYENLQPVINNLHHVRILQQIEVAKNESIASVRDSVTDMDRHINSAKTALDSMQQTLQQFGAQIEKLLSTFSHEISHDNDLVKDLRSDKGNFFTLLEQTHETIASILQNFTVLPEGFEKDCQNVDARLQMLDDIKRKLGDIIGLLANEEKAFTNSKARALETRGVPSWDIKNDRLKMLIKKFTITSHKEAAGKIGGFGVEKGAAAGEITFF
jgi:hypothetical protein